MGDTDLAHRKKLRKYNTEAEEILQWLKALAALTELSFNSWLSFSSSFRGSNALFWLLQALAHVRQAHTAPHVDINKSNFLKVRQNEVKFRWRREAAPLRGMVRWT